MKTSARIFSFALFLFACAFAHGQAFGPYTLTGSQCAAVAVSKRATAAYQISGAWTGTIQPQVSIQGQPAVNTQATPANSTTRQSTITANGAFFTAVPGYTVFLLCGNTITGTATIYINLSTAGH